MKKPTFYVRGIQHGDDIYSEFWCVEDETARKIDIFDSSGIASFHRDPSDKDMITTLRRLVPWGPFHKLDLEPGEFYPRMARPNGLGMPGPGRNPNPSNDFLHSLARSKGQLRAFVEGIDRICRIVHPVADNLECYGHEIRNVLILTCTEVEAHWKNIMKDNQYRKDGRYDNLTTKDYFRLSGAMKLNEYLVNLSQYPWLEPISPFASWSSPDTSKSLGWYRAYNQVKHDRDEHFSEATLHRALTAATACFVMLCAQYGFDFMQSDNQVNEAFFQLIEAPNWEPCAIYVPPYETSLRAKPYPFTRT
jgi:hypothetical protein